MKAALELYIPASRAGAVTFRRQAQLAVTIEKAARPHKAHRNRARACPRARKWGWVGEVWKYCALSELHPQTRVRDADGAAESVLFSRYRSNGSWPPRLPPS
jgi:hypothetical protein